MAIAPVRRPILDRTTRFPWYAGLKYLGEIWEELGTRPPILDEDLRGFLRRELTHRQNRVEFCPAPALRGQEVTVWCLDGRFMYSALCSELGTGPIRREQGGGLVDREYERAWLHVEARVPEGWRHLGLLPARDERGFVTYPCTPGEEFVTWVDGAELLTAWRVGTEEPYRDQPPWALRVIERVVLTQGRPLDVWCDRLRRERDASRDAEQRGWLRDVLLQSIGQLAAHSRTREEWVDDVADIPADWDVEIPEIVQRTDSPPTAGRWVTVAEPLSPFARSMQHPELALAIWARARARVARFLLTVPREAVIAINGDAVYTTQAPAAPETGRAGEFRPKGQPRRMRCPESLPELQEAFRV